jgi:hypothetical protein
MAIVQKIIRASPGYLSCLRVFFFYRLLHILRLEEFSMSGIWYMCRRSIALQYELKYLQGGFVSDSSLNFAAEVVDRHGAHLPAMHEPDGECPGFNYSLGATTAMSGTFCVSLL